MVRIVLANDQACVQEAVRLLRRGGLICYPTDTLYGIGVAASDDAAVRQLFAAKGRGLDKPLPLLIADPGHATQIADVTPLAHALMGRFWPGGLTIVMRKAASFQSLALAGQERVALRVPNHPVTRDIIHFLGEPITGTSANRAGVPPPVTATEAAAQVGDVVSLIIDGGPCRDGLESTVIDMTCEPPRILREGVVRREELEEMLGRSLVPAE